MATRVIPSDVKPDWSCYVNGKKYTYLSGATVDVPDEVAYIIDNYYASQTRPDPAYIPTMPPIGDDSEGKAVIVSGKKYVLGEAGTNITVDAALSDTSENPVQNKVVKAALAAAGGTYYARFILDLSGDAPAISLPPGSTAAGEFSAIATALSSGKSVIAGIAIMPGGLMSFAPLSKARFQSVPGMGDPIGFEFEKAIDLSSADDDANINMGRVFITAEGVGVKMIPMAVSES